MFNIVEIDKLFQYTESFTPVEPYIFSTQITNTKIASYWTDIFGADGTYNDVLKQINSVVLNSYVELLKESSYNDMQSKTSSFYYDYDNQTLYINTQLNPQASNVTIGVMSGYSTDTVRYFNSQEYIPVVTSIPTITEQADPLQYSMIAFASGSVELSNPLINGAFLFNAREKLRGNTVRILRGKDGDSYDDLILVFSGYISNVEVNTSSVTLELGDNREKLEVKYPVNIFSTDDNINLSYEDTIDKLIPDGYGDVIQAEAYPINASGFGYQWCKKATSITQVYAMKGDVLTAINHYHDSDWLLSEGRFYTSLADAFEDGDITKSRYDIYVTGRMRDFDNPADIISDLNLQALGIEYNSSNYNQTEWESEKTSLANVALYMDSSKSLYEWIEMLQAGSNIGFRYEDSDKRTIRLDNKSRTPITFTDGTTSIEPIDIRNSDIPIDQNADLYASSVIVKYSKNLRTGVYQQVTNNDHYDEVIREFRVEKVDEYESLLTSKTDAESKASLISDDEKTIRPIIELTLESSKFASPRIYDIINAKASLIVQGVYQDNLTNVLADTELLGDEIGLIGELFGMAISEVKDNGTIEFYGEFVGEVMSISPDTSTDTVTIKLRDIGD